MLYIGVIFILLGLYCILGELFDINILMREKTLVRREQFIIDEYYKLKFILGIFAITVGIFSIVNYLIY